MWRKGCLVWYVIQVYGGREKHVLGLIEKLVNPALVKEVFIPQYEVMKRIGGKWVRRREVLLPGYLFVVTPDPSALHSELARVPELTKILSTSDGFVPLDPFDVSFINAFMQEGHRVVDMSEGVIEGDDIVILNGPLMGHTGLIKKIDRHKRLAYLEIPIMGRTKVVKIGLEIVRKR